CRNGFPSLFCGSVPGDSQPSGEDEEAEGTLTSEPGLAGKASPCSAFVWARTGSEVASNTIIRLRCTKYIVARGGLEASCNLCRNTDVVCDLRYLQHSLPTCVGAESLLWNKNHVSGLQRSALHRPGEQSALARCDRAIGTNHKHRALIREVGWSAS